MYLHEQLAATERGHLNVEHKISLSGNITLVHKRGRKPVRQLRVLKFYLETLEEFSNHERAQEILELKKQINPEQRDQHEEFWAWHYPVHWDAIFASQLRFIICDYLNILGGNSFRYDHQPSLRDCQYSY